MGEEALGAAEVWDRTGDWMIEAALIVEGGADGCRASLEGTRPGKAFG
jgi:hypothetical protein